jgi:hypothetical protein
LPRPQVSVVKRQREQAKRERRERKAEKRAQRKNDKEAGTDVMAGDEFTELETAEIVE